MNLTEFYMEKVSGKGLDMADKIFNKALPSLLGGLAGGEALERVGKEDKRKRNFFIGSALGIGGGVGGRKIYRMQKELKELRKLR